MTNKFSKTEPIYIHKRIINNNAIEMFRHKLHESYKMFRHKLHESDWAEVETSRSPNVFHKIFYQKSFKKFVSL